ncbi:MAG: hypothetical protein R3C05_09980 [Pirellulaceae bacterium]
MTSHRATTFTEPSPAIVRRLPPPRPPTPMNATFMRSFAAARVVLLETASPADTVAA